jgi:arylsulfatase
MKKSWQKKMLLQLSAFGLVVTSAANLYMPSIADAAEKEQSQVEKVVTNDKQKKAEKTNVIYIVLDDMGFSDFGCYGSEIKTPNIDKLASNGLIYNNFNACPVCSPTRASLLTGRDNHSVGMGSLANVDMGPQNPNLRARINDNAATVAQILKSNGYSTMGVGKWHVAPITSATPAGPFDYWPVAKGFERYYGHLGGETDQYDPILIYDNHAVPENKYANKEYQFSQDMIDKAKQFLADQVSVTPEKPFFLYVAFSAVHSPHQAPQKYIDMYDGVYDKGWEKIRQERFERQRAMGVIPANAQLTPRDVTVQEWDSLSDKEKKLFVKFQQTYAGYLSYADAQVGQLTQYLKSIGQLDNTMIVMISDNGATPSGEKNGTDYDLKAFRQIFPTTEKLIPLTDKIGGPEVAAIYPKGWAMASNTPFQNYKFSLYNGGVRTPLIISYPNKIKAHGEVRDQYVHVKDITSTVLDMLNIKASETFQGIEQLPMHGKSIIQSFNSNKPITESDVQYYLFASNRSIYKDGWKAIARHKKGTSFDADSWELYHDYAEADNVAEKYPEKLKELQALWKSEAEKYGAPLKESGYEAISSKDKTLKYFAGTSTMSSGAAPDLSKSSYTMTIPVTITDKKQEGVLVSLGNETTGYTLYVKNNRLVYEYHYFGEVTRMESKEKLPMGKSIIKYQFDRTTKTGGEGKLIVNDQIVASAKIQKTFGPSSDETFDIGCDRHLKVSKKYKKQGSFPFTGQYDYVEFEFQKK